MVDYFLKYKHQVKKLFYFWPDKIWNMKNILLAAVVIVFASCQNDKIAFVDNVRLMENSEEKMDIEAEFKAKSAALNKKRDSISQAFQLEAQALQTKVESLPQKEAQEEYDNLQQRGQFMGQQLQQEEQILQQQGQAEMDSLISKVKDEIKDYGKANGFTYILGGGEGGSVLYGQESKDVTDDILKIINDKYEN